MESPIINYPQATVCIEGGVSYIKCTCSEAENISFFNNDKKFTVVDMEIFRNML